MSCLLLTGPPGIGKSTIIQRTLSMLVQPAGGFFTRELRLPAGAHGQTRRAGFEIVTLAGKSSVLAHKVQHFPQQVRFKSYYVNLEAIEQVAVPAIRHAFQAGSLIVVDEIGPMELLSPLFCRVVQEAIGSEAPIFGTIMQRHHPLADTIKDDPRVSLQRVTPANREALPARLARRLNTV